MANHDFTTTVSSLFKGMDAYLSTKTVVGEPMNVGNNILIPLADVSFGVAAGAFSGNGKERGAGGLGAKVSPTAFLIVNDNGVRIVGIKNQDTFSKLFDLIPEVVNRFTKKNKNEISDDEVDEIIREAEEKAEEE